MFEPRAGGSGAGKRGGARRRSNGEGEEKCRVGGTRREWKVRADPVKKANSGQGSKEKGEISRVRKAIGVESKEVP